MEELISSVYLFSEIIILCSQFPTGLKRIISLILSSFLLFMDSMLSLSSVTELAS